MLHFYIHDVFPLKKIILPSLLMTALAANSETTFTINGINYRDCSEPLAAKHNIVEVMRGSEIPDSVLTIPHQVRSPEGTLYTVARISIQSFAGRKDIKKVNLPKEGLINLWQGAFDGCSNLEEIDLTHVYRMYAQTFRGCTSLKKVIMPKSMTHLDTEVFSGCHNLSEIDLSEIRELEPYALYRCTLTRCVPPHELTRIGNYALSLTRGIRSITYTGDLSHIYPYALYGSNVESVTLRCGNPVEIPDFAFRSCKQLTSVSVEGAGVKSIGKGAFMDCELLKPFTLDGVITIGDFAFSGCRVWDTLELPKSLTSIGEQAFYNAAFTHVEFPEWVKESNIGAGAFQSAKLVSVKWPATWSDLTRHRNMFANSTATLEEVVLPGRCTTIPDELFYHCTRLRTVTGNKYITKIGKYAFFNCAALESFNHTSMIEEIGDGAFSGCKAIKKLDLHKVKSIPYGAFNGCESLETIYGDYGMGVITYVGERAFKGSGIIDMVFGDNTVIDNEAFMDCKRLTGLGIIYDLITHRETMDDYLFFPSTIKSIGVDAFRNCTSLKGIYIQGDADGSTPLVLKVNQKYNYRSPFAGCSIENVVLEREVTLDTSDSPWSPLNFICPETKFLRLANHSISMSRYTLPLSCLPVDSKGVLGLSKLEKLHICNKIDCLPSLAQSPRLREIVIRGDNYEPPTATAFHPDTYTFGKLDITDTGDEKAYRTTDPWSNFYKSPSSINETMDAVSDDDSQVEYYDIYGNRLDAPHHGMMIIRKNGKSSKVFVE